VTGPGALEIAGGTVWAVTDSATTVQGEAHLLIDGGWLKTAPDGIVMLSDGTSGHLASGQLGGDGTVEIAGTFDWTGGAIRGSGGVTNIGPDFTITGAAEKLIERHNSTLTNSGMIRQGGDAVVTMMGGRSWPSDYPAFIHNLSDGLYDFQGDGQILLGEREGYGITSQYNTLNNAGTFRKSGGAGDRGTVREHRNRRGSERHIGVQRRI